MYYIMYISDADISRLGDDNDIIIKITEFVFLCFTKISENKYKVLFKRILMTLKSCKKEMIMRENYFQHYIWFLKQCNFVLINFSIQRYNK